MAAPPPVFRSAERLVFFTDAVVAIAMTLLILPLLESVAEASRAGLDTAGYFAEHDGQVIAFALSFVIIAAFWLSHQRLFNHVRRQDGVLAWLNIAWMSTIVWLPVATALVGGMETDQLQIAIYIGTMLVTSLLTLAMLLWLRKRPELVDPADPPGPGVHISMILVVVLFAVALLAALMVPGLNYAALLVMLLNAPLGAVLRRRSHN